MATTAPAAPALQLVAADTADGQRASQPAAADQQPSTAPGQQTGRRTAARAVGQQSEPPSQGVSPNGQDVTPQQAAGGAGPIDDESTAQSAASPTENA